jgi:hypothetical protein
MGIVARCAKPNPPNIEMISSISMRNQACRFIIFVISATIKPSTYGLRAQLESIHTKRSQSQLSSLAKKMLEQEMDIPCVDVPGAYR